MNPPDRAQDEKRKFQAIGTGNFQSIPQSLFMYDPMGDPEKFDTRRANDRDTFTSNQANLSSDYLNRLHGKTTGVKNYSLEAGYTQRARQYGLMGIRHFQSDN